MNKQQQHVLNLCLWGGLLFFCLGCLTDSEPVETSPPTPAPPKNKEAQQESWFENQAEALGLDFQHVDARSGERYYVETAASGGGFFDYDGDGDLDIYLLNGAPTPGYSGNGELENAMFENRDGAFVNVTEASGLGDRGYGMGMSVGDVDGDGLVDLFITNYGADKLYRNLGKGRFEDWTAQAGVGGPRWGTSSAFGDVDGDGDLDLYVTNYVDFSFENNPKCGSDVDGVGSYCRPSVFSGQPDYLYINQGDGRFVEESVARGIDQGDEGKGFGVLLTDMDGDGDLDILVANDGTMNRYFRNDGRGYFEDISLQSGLGYNSAGLAESGMGIAAEDMDADGKLDLLVTNYSFETNTLYLQRMGGIWEDVTVVSGLSGPTYLPVGWGIGCFDVENDGDMDLAIGNGHVMDNIAHFEPNISYPQANLLLLNQGRAKFEDRSSWGGSGFTGKKVTRGLAVGDVNNDGLLDVLLTNTNGTPDLLVNRAPQKGNWLGFRLVGPQHNRLAIGAKLRLLNGNGQLLGVREVRSGGSFLTQNDLRLHIGLGQESGPLKAVVRWPDGREQTQDINEVNAYVTLSYENQE